MVKHTEKFESGDDRSRKITPQKRHFHPAASESESAKHLTGNPFLDNMERDIPYLNVHPANFNSSSEGHDTKRQRLEAVDEPEKIQKIFTDIMYVVKQIGADKSHQNVIDTFEKYFTDRIEKKGANSDYVGIWKDCRDRLRTLKNCQSGFAKGIRALKALIEHNLIPSPVLGAERRPFYKMIENLMKQTEALKEETVVNLDCFLRRQEHLINGLSDPPLSTLAEWTGKQLVESPDLMSVDEKAPKSVFGYKEIEAQSNKDSDGRHPTKTRITRDPNGGMIYHPSGLAYSRGERTQKINIQSDQQELLRGSDQTLSNDGPGHSRNLEFAHGYIKVYEDQYTQNDREYAPYNYSLLGNAEIGGPIPDKANPYVSKYESLSFSKVEDTSTVRTEWTKPREVSSLTEEDIRALGNVIKSLDFATLEAFREDMEYDAIKTQKLKDSTDDVKFLEELHRDKDFDPEKTGLNLVKDAAYRLIKLVDAELVSYVSLNNTKKAFKSNLEATIKKNNLNMTLEHLSRYVYSLMPPEFLVPQDTSQTSSNQIDLEIPSDWKEKQLRDQSASSKLIHSLANEVICKISDNAFNLLGENAPNPDDPESFDAKVKRSQDPSRDAPDFPLGADKLKNWLSRNDTSFPVEKMYLSHWMAMNSIREGRQEIIEKEKAVLGLKILYILTKECFNRYPPKVKRKIKPFIDEVTELLSRQSITFEQIKNLDVGSNIKDVGLNIPEFEGYKKDYDIYNAETVHNPEYPEYNEKGINGMESNNWITSSKQGGIPKITSKESHSSFETDFTVDSVQRNKFEELKREYRPIKSARRDIIYMLANRTRGRIPRIQKSQEIDKKISAMAQEKFKQTIQNKYAQSTVWQKLAERSVQSKKETDDKVKFDSEAEFSDSKTVAPQTALNDETTKLVKELWLNKTFKEAQENVFGQTRIFETDNITDGTIIDGIQEKFLGCLEIWNQHLESIKNKISEKIDHENGDTKIKEYINNEINQLVDNNGERDKIVNWIYCQQINKYIEGFLRIQEEKESLNMNSVMKKVRRLSILPSEIGCEVIRPYPGSQGTSSQIEASVSTATPIGIESIASEFLYNDHLRKAVWEGIQWNKTKQSEYDPTTHYVEEVWLNKKDSQVALEEIIYPNENYKEFTIEQWKDVRRNIKGKFLKCLENTYRFLESVKDYVIINQMFETYNNRDITVDQLKQNIKDDIGDIITSNETYDKNSWHIRSINKHVQDNDQKFLRTDECNSIWNFIYERQIEQYIKKPEIEDLFNYAEEKIDRTLNKLDSLPNNLLDDGWKNSSKHENPKIQTLAYEFCLTNSITDSEDLEVQQYLKAGLNDNEKEGMKWQIVRYVKTLMYLQLNDPKYKETPPLSKSDGDILAQAFFQELAKNDTGTNSSSTEQPSSSLQHNPYLANQALDPYGTSLLGTLSSDNQDLDQLSEPKMEVDNSGYESSVNQQSGDVNQAGSQRVGNKIELDIDPRRLEVYERAKIKRIAIRIAIRTAIRTDHKWDSITNKTVNNMKLLDHIWETTPDDIPEHVPNKPLIQQLTKTYWLQRNFADDQRKGLQEIGSLTGQQAIAIQNKYFTCLDNLNMQLGQKESFSREVHIKLLNDMIDYIESYTRVEDRNMLLRVDS